MRVAGPPVPGSVQMLPCRSIASVRPSGETATDIDVPSETVTSIGDPAAAPGRCCCASPLVCNARPLTAATPSAEEKSRRKDMIGASSLFFSVLSERNRMTRQVLLAAALTLLVPQLPHAQTPARKAAPAPAKTTAKDLPPMKKFPTA